MNLHKKSKRAHRHLSLKESLTILVLITVLPFLIITVYLIVSLRDYSRSYDTIISNMTIVNNYNLVFKEQMDESLYKLVVGAVTFENISADNNLQNPYLTIRDLRQDTKELITLTADTESSMWLQSMLRSLNSLETCVDEIKTNLDDGGHYDENIQILDSDIYILTELIQDDMTHYIYAQASDMDRLRSALDVKIKDFIRVLTIVALVLLVVILLISTEILGRITRSVNNLLSVTEGISEGDLSVRADESPIIEFDSVSGSMNEMVENLERLIGQIKEDERQMRISELRLLQEQINPHFLYNTLDTIIWLIEGKMDKEAEEMVVALSDFFRLVLNNGKEYVCVRDERNHIERYLQIQRARYKDILKYDIQIPEELSEYRILKLVLQPLVENALYHGIKYKRAAGTIIIKGKIIDGAIVFEVIDDGVGMDESELANLYDRIEHPDRDQNGGFGLSNVNERLKMYYGSEYGLKIESTKGVGTTCYVRVPIETTEGPE